MKYRLEIGRGVRLEIAEHWAFWETFQPGSGDRLTAEIFEMLDILQDNPYLFQSKYGDRRVALTKHYKYKIIYRIKDKSVVRILTIRHPRQHPTSWMERL